MFFNTGTLSLTLSSRMALAGLATTWLSWSDLALAQDITCRKGEESRRVRVMLDQTGKELPCEVVLWSTPGQPPRSLWRAEFQRGFCADKLHAMVDQLTDDQWRCAPTRSRAVKPKPTGRPPTM